MAMVHDDDEIGIDDGGETVCDGDDGTVFHQRVKRLLDKMFRGCIESGCRFVENEYWRIFEQRAGDGEALLLAAGEKGAAFAGHAVVFFRFRQDEFICVGLMCGFDDLFFRRVRRAVLDVFADGVVEKERILRDDADELAEGGIVDIADILSIYRDDSAGRIVESGDEIGDG